MNNFHSNIFPVFERSLKAQWAALLINPIVGSYERHVIAVATTDGTLSHLEIANATERLRCFYGSNAHAIEKAIEIATFAFEKDLKKRVLHALTDPRLTVSGVDISPVSVAEGESLEGISKRLMENLSSLYDGNINKELEMIGRMEAYAQFAGSDHSISSTADRLPSLVLDFVSKEKSGLVKYFNADLRANKRNKKKSHEAMIHFAGSKLVANFGTLHAGGISRSVNLIKRRLWDLKLDRDRDPSSLVRRNHEMLLQRPGKDDPQVTQKQLDHLEEALAGLEAEADQEQLRLRAMSSTQAIALHIIQSEAA